MFESFSSLEAIKLGVTCPSLSATAVIDVENVALTMAYTNLIDGKQLFTSSHARNKVIAVSVCKRVK